MTVEVYMLRQFENYHERSAFARLLEDLLTIYRLSPELLCIVVRPEASGEKDVLLLKTNALVLVELKTLALVEPYERRNVRLQICESADWKYSISDGPSQQMHGNAYEQVSDGRYKIAERIANCREIFPSGAITREHILERLYGWVAIAPGFDGQVDYAQIPEQQISFHWRRARWLSVLSLEDCAGAFESARRPDPLTENQVRAAARLFAPLYDGGVGSLAPYATPAPTAWSRPPIKNALVDREPEREALRRAVDWQDQFISTVVLQGLAGAGRTASAGWLAGYAQEHSTRVRWLDCRTQDTLTLDGFLAGVAEEIGDLRAVAIRDPRRPKDERMEVALTYLGERPTLLIFDDYNALQHRVTFDAFVSRATRHRDRVRVLLTTTEQIVDELPLFDSLITVLLEPLAYADFAKLLPLVASHTEFSEEEARVVWTRLDGNPGALQSSVRLIRQYKLERRLPDLPVPDSEVWFDSLCAQLPRGGIELLRRLAVIRRRFDYPVIKMLAGNGDQAASLTIVFQDRFLIEARESDEGFALRSLVRGRILAASSTTELRAAHSAVQKCFEQLAANATDAAERAALYIEVVYHLDNTGPGGRNEAAKILEKAHEAFLAANDWDQAQAAGERLLDILSIVAPAPAKATSWRVRLARLALDRDQRQAAAEHLAGVQEWLASAPAGRSPDQKATRTALMMEYFLVQGRYDYHVPDYESSLERFSQALTMARGSSNSRAELEALIGMGRVMRHRKRYQEAKECFDAVVDGARQLHDLRLLGEGLSHRGLIARSYGEFDLAIRLFRESLDAARQAAEPVAYEKYLGHLGRTLFFQGDFAGAVAIFRDCLNRARIANDRRGIRYQLVNLADALIAQGELEDAETVVQESEGLNRSASDRIGSAFNVKHRGLMAKRRGDREAGNQLIQQGIEALRHAGNEEYLQEFQDALQSGSQLQFDLM